MKITDFDIYKDLLKKKSGLVITPDKSYLLESRLGPVAKKWGYASMDAMTLALQGVPDQKLIIDIVEAMTTNETSFFRDTRPFDLFKDFVVPEIQKIKGMNKTLNIWCAAASSGQEPYSLSMLLKEDANTKMAGWRTNILATDISQDILEQAKEGVYSQFEVQRGLPIKLLMNYFTQEDEKWRIKDEIKQMVKYEMFNLLDSMTRLGKFDIVFCRNVLIYFDETDKRDILERIAAQMEPHGVLFLGGAETVIGITKAFTAVPEKRGIYTTPDSKFLSAIKEDSAGGI